jgi:fatty acid desaturase
VIVRRVFAPRQLRQRVGETILLAGLLLLGRLLLSGITLLGHDCCERGGMS